MLNGPYNVALLRESEFNRDRDQLDNLAYLLEKSGILFFSKGRGPCLFNRFQILSDKKKKNNIKKFVENIFVIIKEVDSNSIFIPIRYDL